MCTLESELAETARRQLHLIVAGDWSSIDRRLIEYFEDELGTDPSKDPVGVAFCLLKLGIPPEKATTLLSWKEFEGFCMRGLQLCGMEALGRIMFKHHGRRYEIDVLGLRNDLSLILECKMWSMRTRSSKIVAEAKKHLTRVLAFNEAMKSGSIELLSRKSGKSFLIPVIVSWLDVGSTRFEGKVAIVSLSVFPRFLEALDELKEDFIEADYRITLREGPSPPQSTLKF